MRTCFVLIVLVVASSQSTAQTPDAPEQKSTRARKEAGSEPKALDGKQMKKLQTYFDRYCDYTGSLGIGFVASHTYAYEFRQRLKSTKDLELKRLFVLQRLYGDVENRMRDYERGEQRVGKVEYEKMTAREKDEARRELLDMLDDLEAFDPGDPQREIASHRKKLK